LLVTEKQREPLGKPAPADSKSRTRRIGFAEGQFSVPDDFDHMFEKEIEVLFTGVGSDGD
jgi:hypothetical protein